MGSSFVRLAGVAIRETGEQLLKRLGSESDRAAQVIGSQAEPFAKAIIKEIDSNPPTAQIVTNYIRKGEFDKYNDFGNKLLQKPVIEKDQIELNNILSKNKPQPEVETKPYQLSEGVEDFMGDTDLQSARNWLKPDGELDQLAESKFLTAGTKRKVKDPTGKIIEIPKGSRLTYDQLSKSDQDYLDSLMATGFKTSPDDELAYGFGASELSKMSGLEGFDPKFSPQLHKGKTFHHKGMKKIRSTIHRRARQLVREGKATVDDLVNLHAMSVAKGSPSGSRKSAGMWLEEFGHNITHKKVAQDPEFGYEPTTTKAVNKFRGGGKTKPKNISAKVWNPANEAALNLDVTLTPFDIEYIDVWIKTYKDIDKAIARWKVFRQSNAYDLLKPDGLSEMDRLLEPVNNMNIAELTQFQKELIDDIDTPMTEDMILMEEVIDKLSARELFELQKNKDWDSLLNLRNTLKEKKGDISEALENEKMRQLGG